MDLIALAIGPGIAICLFIFHRDAYNKEPKLNLLVCFILGAAGILPAYYIETAFMGSIEASVSGIVILSFIVVALTEEMTKFIALRYYAYPLKSFDEPLDGIVYAVMIGMGFATAENIRYVFVVAEPGKAYDTGLLRMFTAVPAHATFGVLMGYFAGKAKLDPSNSSRLLFLGLFWAVLFHGAYDFFQMLTLLPEYSSDTTQGLLFLGALVSFVIALRLSFKHIKTHRVLSQRTYYPTLTMSIRKAFPGDIPLIRDLTYKIWPQTYSSILSKEQIDYMLNLMYSEKALQEQMQQNHEFIVAYDGVEPVGFASYSLIEPTVFKLHKIYVLPSQQGRGTGRFIIDQLIKLMKPKGITALQLNVNRQNNAKDFYEKLGFVVIKEEDIDIGGGYFMNDYVMEKKF
jgi:RsiW-degrading membrane proteinase PrsW (M82 family)/ribosomal protein S18 acetylase RimI-like enzyme